MESTLTWHYKYKLSSAWSALERTGHDELGRVPFLVLFTFGVVSDLNQKA